MVSRTRAFLVSKLVVATLVTMVLMVCACSPLQTGDQPTLVFFRAANCPYCKEMTPIVEQIEQKHGQQLNVVYAQVEQQQGKELARQHGIIGYPTVLLLDSEGEQVGILRGVVPLPSLEKVVNDLLQAEQ